MTIGEAKNEAAQRIQTESLSTLTIPQADLLSGKAIIIDQKELRYDGALYDISTTSIHGDQVTFTLLHDEKEEGMISKLKDLIDSAVGATPKNGKSPTVKHIVVLTDYIPTDTLALLLHCPCRTFAFAIHSQSPDAPLSTVLKSPPKFV